MMHSPALAGNVEVVECLTAYGANVNTADSKGNTALSLASFSVSTRTEAVVETLLKVCQRPSFPF
jgi:ankyrin repeat protein